MAYRPSSGDAVVYTDPHHILAYPDGSVHQQVAICFHATTHDTQSPRPDAEETTAAAWFEPHDTIALPMQPAVRLRLTAATATLNLPFVTAQFRRPEVHLPRVGRPDVGPAAGAAAATARSLSPAELAYYAGLGVLAVIEWPVALVVGAGTALARSGRNGGGGRGAGDTGAGGDRGSLGAGAEGSRQD